MTDNFLKSIFFCFLFGQFFGRINSKSEDNNESIDESSFSLKQANMNKNQKIIDEGMKNSNHKTSKNYGRVLNDEKISQKANEEILKNYQENTLKIYFYSKISEDLSNDHIISLVVIFHCSF